MTASTRSGQRRASKPSCRHRIAPLRVPGGTSGDITWNSRYYIPWGAGCQPPAASRAAEPAGAGRRSLRRRRAMQPFLDSTNLAADPAALNERLAAEGYLFIRGLLPRAAVLEVRRQCRAVAAAGGWLDPAYPVDDGVANPAAACTDPEPRYVEVFRRLYDSSRCTPSSTTPRSWASSSGYSASRSWCTRSSSCGTSSRSAPIDHARSPGLRAHPGHARHVHGVDPPGRRSAGAGEPAGRRRVAPGRGPGVPGDERLGGPGSRRLLWSTAGAPARSRQATSSSSTASRFTRVCPTSPTGCASRWTRAISGRANPSPS